LQVEIKFAKNATATGWLTIMFVSWQKSNNWEKLVGAWLKMQDLLSVREN
jgi:hypothetical protein